MARFDLLGRLDGQELVGQLFLTHSEELHESLARSGDVVDGAVDGQFFTRPEYKVYTFSGSVHAEDGCIMRLAVYDADVKRRSPKGYLVLKGPSCTHLNGSYDGRWYEANSMEQLRNLNRRGFPELLEDGMDAYITAASFETP